MATRCRQLTSTSEEIRVELPGTGTRDRLTLRIQGERTTTRREDQLIAIELDEPRGGGTHDPSSGLTLSEALASAFESTEGCAWVSWNGVRFSLPYKYDAAEISSCLIFVLKKILEEPVGNLDISLATSSFPFSWEARWNERILEILAKADFDRDVKKAMRGHEALRTTREEFCRVWSPLLCTWKSRLESLRYRGKDVDEMIALCEIIDRIHSKE